MITNMASGDLPHLCSMTPAILHVESPQANCLNRLIRMPMGILVSWCSHLAGYIWCMEIPRMKGPLEAQGRLGGNMCRNHYVLRHLSSRPGVSLAFWMVSVCVTGCRACAQKLVTAGSASWQILPGSLQLKSCLGNELAQRKAHTHGNKVPNKLEVWSQKERLSTPLCVKQDAFLVAPCPWVGALETSRN